MKYLYYLIATVSLSLLWMCQNGGHPSPEQLYHLPSKTAKGVQAVVEIPAGTNRKIEYKTNSKGFEIDRTKGQERVVDFLPYPGNYGFIPSTYMDPERGGDGDALDILIISESLPTGTPIETIPIATILLKDDGELDTKIIAVPVDSSLRVIQATNFKDFLVEYNAAKYIIEQWFLSYKGIGKMDLIGWRDERLALEEIERWQLR